MTVEQETFEKIQDELISTMEKLIHFNYLIKRFFFKLIIISFIALISNAACFSLSKSPSMEPVESKFFIVLAYLIEVAFFIIMMIYGSSLIKGKKDIDKNILQCRILDAKLADIAVKNKEINVLKYFEIEMDISYIISETGKNINGLILLKYFVIAMMMLMFLLPNQTTNIDVVETVFLIAFAILALTDIYNFFIKNEEKENKNEN